ncbi:Peptidoglycan DL-endopeptidase CwlO precursor [Paraliobacillus sp. PM-2]|uniref:murein hydrolase activator EnvC family protein n=1 Tax=Paraliobacillus sp. PM-2 TaxID=1462524 RepID=UPI00061C0D48|nr:M23 family metallopeptidase [Paraliobacillus sp. PM-2]CQR46453.1 Peptidoglycan DL-endopeptidase CwlO precursor [Paraliobacillus sp. PM-2]
MKKVFTYITALIVIMGIMLPSLSTVTAESLADLEEKLDQVEKDKNNASNKKKSTKEKIAENETQQAETANDIDTINAQLDETQAKLTKKENEIATTNQQINDKEKEIKQTEEQIEQLKVEIKELKQRIAEREKLLKNRLRSIQQNGGDINYLAVLMGAQSFGDFINRATVVTKIMAQDKTIMESHQQDKKDLEVKKVSVEDKQKQLKEDKEILENRKENLVVQKNELDSLQATLDSQIERKRTLMAELEEEHAHLEEYRMSLAEQQETLANQQAVIERAIEEAKKEESEQNNNNDGDDNDSSLSGGGNGSLIWPTTGRRSSDYGYRDFNGGGFHYGLDIANSVGTPIKAAASGYVTRANYSNSYGNVVYIYHPDLKITTVYAHMNRLSVSYNQRVNKGQQIGTMGNTGNSFGSHLHFEVHKNYWSYHGGIDPMKYLP